MFCYHCQGAIRSGEVRYDNSHGSSLHESCFKHGRKMTIQEYSDLQRIDGEPERFDEQFEQEG